MGHGKWVKMVDSGQQRVTIQMCHIPNASEAKKKPSMEPKTCQKGPKVGSKYWRTFKTWRYVRTACAVRAYCMHGIPQRLISGPCRSTCPAGGLHTRPQQVIHSPGPSPHGTRSRTHGKRWPSPLSCGLPCPWKIPPRMHAYGRFNLGRATSNHGRP